MRAAGARACPATLHEGPMSLKDDLAALDRAIASSRVANPRAKPPQMKPETIARRAVEHAREREARHADLVRRLRERLDADPGFVEMIGEEILPEVQAARPSLRAWAAEKAWRVAARTTKPIRVSPERAAAILAEARRTAAGAPEADFLTRVMTPGEYRWIYELWMRSAKNQSFIRTIETIAR